MTQNDTKNDKNDEKWQKIIKKKPENDEDDEENFRNKDEEVKEELLEKIKKELEDVKKKLEGILPESNQQRNLDRETGGLEMQEDKGISGKDAWDDRGGEINAMIEDGRDLNNASKSSRNQSFIHRKKQQKKNEKSNKEAAEQSFENMGYVARLKNLKQDKSGFNKNSGAGFSGGR